VRGVRGEGRAKGRGRSWSYNLPALPEVPEYVDLETEGEGNGTGEGGSSGDSGCEERKGGLRDENVKDREKGKGKEKEKKRVRFRSWSVGDKGRSRSRTGVGKKLLSEVVREEGIEP